MKKRWKLLLTLGLALVAVGLMVYLGLAQPQASLVLLHKDSGSISQDACISCHGDMRLEEYPLTRAPNVTAHKRHSMSVYLKFNTPEVGCAKCHQSTDIRQESSAALRKQVEPRLCLSCHGTFTTVNSPDNPPIPENAHLNSLTGVTVAQSDPRGCAKCHRVGGPAAVPTDKHRLVPYVNLRYASTSISCLKCHGGQVWYTTAQELNFPTGFLPYWPQP